MHYSRTNFAKKDDQGQNVGNVIDILDPDVSFEILATGRDIGWNFLSARDAVQVQLMYHCTFQEPFVGDVLAQVPAPRGMRRMSDLCDSDCPCYEGQGKRIVLSSLD
jgi:hypothetical protein